MATTRASGNLASKCESYIESAFRRQDRAAKAPLASNSDYTKRLIDLTRANVARLSVAL
jgi:hypothetical protein